MLSDTHNYGSMFSKNKTNGIQAAVKVSDWLTGVTSLFFFSLLPPLCCDHRLPVQFLRQLEALICHKHNT